ncbi:unnamed protein product, partial [Protopolystoma xenopodis]
MPAGVSDPPNIHPSTLSTLLVSPLKLSNSPSSTVEPTSKVSPTNESPMTYLHSNIPTSTTITQSEQAEAPTLAPSNVYDTSTTAQPIVSSLFISTPVWSKVSSTLGYTSSEYDLTTTLDSDFPIRTIFTPPEPTETLTPLSKTPSTVEPTSTASYNFSIHTTSLDPNFSTGSTVTQQEQEEVPSMPGGASDLSSTTTSTSSTLFISTLDSPQIASTLKPSSSEYSSTTTLDPNISSSSMITQAEQGEIPSMPVGVSDLSSTTATTPTALFISTLDSPKITSTLEPSSSEYSSMTTLDPNFSTGSTVTQPEQEVASMPVGASDLFSTTASTSSTLLISTVDSSKVHSTLEPSSSEYSSTTTLDPNISSSSMVTQPEQGEIPSISVGVSDFSSTTATTPTILFISTLDSPQITSTLKPSSSEYTSTITLDPNISSSSMITQAEQGGIPSM